MDELPKWPEPLSHSRISTDEISGMAYLDEPDYLAYERARAAYWEARCRVAVEKLEGISERPSGYHDCGDYERGYGDGRNAAGAMARVTLAEIGPLPEPTP